MINRAERCIRPLTTNKKKEQEKEQKEKSRKEVAVL